MDCLQDGSMEEADHLLMVAFYLRSAILKVATK